MSDTKYDYERSVELRERRKSLLAEAQGITERAKSASRDLTEGEREAVDKAMKGIGGIDAELRREDELLAKAVMGLTNVEGEPPSDRTSAEGYFNLGAKGLATSVASKFGERLGIKSVIDASLPYTSITIDSQPIVMPGRAPTTLLNILPGAVRPVVYRYMRQTSRTDAAAPVAVGGTKPTSSYGLTPVDGRLHVIAHVSEPMDEYQLKDAPMLLSFVQQEMLAGLNNAVQTQILSGDGTGENLTGLLNTSGIQTQAYDTVSKLTTLRKAITDVETLSLVPAYFVLNPTDWEAIETQTLTAGQYVLNAEGSRSGIPVDSAAKRLWGVPVALATGLTAGTALLISNGAVQVASDGRIDTKVAAINDDFTKNQVRLRVEGRFDLSVFQPTGVVKVTLA